MSSTLPLFDIVNVFKIRESGHFLFVRHLNPEVTFEIKPGTTLGGIELDQYFDIPRLTDAEGNQIPDIYALKPKNDSDAELFWEGQTVEMRC